MAKRKYPSEINTRTVRVALDDWVMLNEMAAEANVTVAEAFHEILERLFGQDIRVVPPRSSIRQVATAVLGARPKVSIVVNGAKRSAFRIWPRGGKIHG